MESYFDQLKRAITPFTAPADKSATAMDSIADRMADAAAASYIASVAEDADFKEEDHPRNTKGGTGGGRFRTSGKTIEKEDDLSGSEPKKDPVLKIGDFQERVERSIRDLGLPDKVKFHDVASTREFHVSFPKSGSNVEDIRLGRIIEKCAEHAGVKLESKMWKENFVAPDYIDEVFMTFSSK